MLLGGLPTGIVGRFMSASINVDRNAITTMAMVLRHTGDPLLAAFPTMSLQPGVLATEDELPSVASPGALRGATEAVMQGIAPQGRSVIVRLPPVVHGEGDRNGLLPQLIKIAEKKHACSEAMQEDRPINGPVPQWKTFRPAAVT